MNLLQVSTLPLVLGVLGLQRLTLNPISLAKAKNLEFIFPVLTSTTDAILSKSISSGMPPMNLKAFIKYSKTSSRVFSFLYS